MSWKNVKSNIRFSCFGSEDIFLYGFHCEEISQSGKGWYCKVVLLFFLVGKASHRLSFYPLCRSFQLQMGLRSNLG